MEYRMTIPGFENRNIMVRAGEFFHGARLFIDGIPAEKGAKRGQMLIRRNDGAVVVAQFRATNFIDPVPQLVIDGEVHSLVRPLAWYQWLWGGLPLALIFLGGALGGLAGGLALVINSRLFRSGLYGMVQYALVGLVTAGAVASYIVAASMFNLTIHGCLPENPREYRSEEGGFKIVAPCQLKQEKAERQTAAGIIAFHTHAGELRGRYWGVVHSDYPAAVVGSLGAETMLLNGRNGFVAGVNGRLISDTAVTLNGHPGRRITVLATPEESAGLSLFARFYLVNNRLYQIVAVMPTDKADSAKVNEFMDSFTLIGR